MLNAHVKGVLTSIDFQEIVKVGGKVGEIYEAVIYTKKFKVSPFKNVIDRLFELRQKHKDENNDVMQLLVILIMTNL